METRHKHKLSATKHPTGKHDSAHAKAHAVATSLELVQRHFGEGVALRPLTGGLTNTAFVLSAPTDEATARVHEHFGAHELVLRIPGTHTSSFLSRDVERHNALVASDVGVAPRAFVFERDGTALLPFIRGVTLSNELLAQEGAKYLPKIAGVLRRLHDSPEEHKFIGQFNVFDEVDKYLRLLQGAGGALPAEFAAAHARVHELRVLFERCAGLIPVRNCHCDTVPANFMEEQPSGRLWAIDFEYSGRNDPMWDLGDLAIEAELSAGQIEMLVSAYFGGSVKAFDRARVDVYAVLADFVWGIWGLLAEAENRGFGDYGRNRLRRSAQMMATPGFAAAVATLEQHAAAP